MANPLVECIPNFSEARRSDVMEAIINAIQSVPGIHILDRHSDMDHNRTVLTFVGSPANVEEAAYQAIARASQLINLDQHTGAHPRIGATDVVPFVPISDITMQDCVEMARRLGKRVGETLGIPIYLYEEAATRPERQGLENIRRGQYETLKQEMGVNPDRDPDFGPKAVGTAGATVIGARQPLIAFNVYLTTDDTAIAQKIARAVRHSSGGLRYVKGMGVLVEGRAQVSMNLTNFRASPIARVVEIIRREAGRYGVGIHHSELVGLIPQQALVDAAQWYLQLDGFEPDQILEQRLFEVSREAQLTAIPSKTAFLDELAAATPTPGGGSAAAFSAAAAAALVAMVARLTVGKKKYESVKERMWQMIDQAEALRTSLTEGIERDAASFDAILAAFRLPKDTPEQETIRNTAVEQATIHAAEVPLEAARQAVSVMELAFEAAAIGNVNCISDAGSAMALSLAALTAAGYNVQINISGLVNPSLGQPLLDELAEINSRAAELQAQLKTIMKERANLELP